MNSTTRIAINEVVEKIQNLERVLADEECYSNSILIPLKQSLGGTVERIVQEEAKYTHSRIMEEGYVDDISRIRKLLGIANETEYKA